jgi:hypothetical protein
MFRGARPWSVAFELGENGCDALVSPHSIQAVVANRRRLGQEELKLAKRVFGKRSIEVSKPLGDLLVQGRPLGNRVELDDGRLVEVLSLGDRVALNLARESPPLAAGRSPTCNRQHASTVRRGRSASPQDLDLRSKEDLKTE